MPHPPPSAASKEKAEKSLEKELTELAERRKRLVKEAEETTTQRCKAEEARGEATLSQLRAKHNETMSALEREQGRELAETREKHIRGLESLQTEARDAEAAKVGTPEERSLCRCHTPSIQARGFDLNLAIPLILLMVGKRRTQAYRGAVGG
jgi:hypothetical protein